MPKKTILSESAKPVRDREKAIYCQFHEQIPVKQLVQKKYPRNPNKHSPKQIEVLGCVMKSNGVRHPIVISTLTKRITKGHGKLEAALFNGWTKFPVQYQDYATEADEYADVVADNGVSDLSEIDWDLVVATLADEELKELQNEMDSEINRLAMSLKPAEPKKPKTKKVEFEVNTEPKTCPHCGSTL